MSSKFKSQKQFKFLQGIANKLSDKKSESKKSKFSKKFAKR